MKKLIILAAILTLSGCSVTPPEPPPELTEHGYMEVAGLIVGSDMCLEDGHITPEIHGKGQNIIRSNLARWHYNQATLSNYIDIVRIDNNHPSKLDCDKFASKVYSVNSENEQKRLQRMENIQAQQLMNSNNQYNQLMNTLNRKVYCNNIAGYVICN
ncbi:hypothetical protein [Photobacterium damselae]